MLGTALVLAALESKTIMAAKELAILNDKASRAPWIMPPARYLLRARFSLRRPVHSDKLDYQSGRLCVSGGF